MQESGFRTQETGNRKQETGLPSRSSPQASEGWIRDSGFGIQETGNRRRETALRLASLAPFDFAHPSTSLGVTLSLSKGQGAPSDSRGVQGHSTRQRLAMSELAGSPKAGWQTSRMGRPRRWLIAAALALTGALGAGAVEAQVAVRAKTIHTMAGAAVENGVVLVRDGKVERVGPASGISIPSDYRVLEAEVATPGLIDAHSVVGLAGYLNQPQDSDQLETSAPIQPELRALDAFNARERLVEWLRGLGVTTIHTGHAPRALVSGQTMIVKTTGEETDEAAVVPTAMIAATLGSAGLAEQDKSPGTRAKAVALLRADLIKAQEYLAKQKDAEDAPARDLKLEVLGRVLRKELPLLVTAQRATDITAALRIAEEFDLRVVLDGAAEAYLVTDAIKAAGVPVILHPTMARATGDLENLSMETAATLRKAGIPLALQAGYESYVPKTRVVLFEAAVAAANGLTREEALAAITIDAARILGVDKHLGSLEAGKDADIVLFDGDPLEYTSHVTGVLIDGQVVSSESH
jgi:imidazolonepropionase-like amidohydrolase